ncbi:MAG: hypothetical protein LBH00_12170 [Planctomycetaceae bacterium]|jgi:hypothetical protein|nr:hypothetical protein [Planctomycetaceae bacterium]
MNVHKIFGAVIAVVSGSVLTQKTAAFYASLQKMSRKRYFIIADVLFITVCIIGCALMQTGAEDVRSQIAFDENIFSRKLYPDFMRNIFIISLVNGFFVSGFVLSLLYLFTGRIRHIGYGGMFFVSLCAADLLLLFIAKCNEVFGFVELNLWAMLLFIISITGIFFANFLSIIYSQINSETRKRFFGFPNWYFSFVVCLTLFYILFFAIMFSHITI